MGKEKSGKKALVSEHKKQMVKKLELEDEYRRVSVVIQHLGIQFADASRSCCCIRYGLLSAMIEETLEMYEELSLGAAQSGSASAVESREETPLLGPVAKMRSGLQQFAQTSKRWAEVEEKYSNMSPNELKADLAKVKQEVTELASLLYDSRRRVEQLSMDYAQARDYSCCSRYGVLQQIIKTACRGQKAAARGTGASLA